MSGAEVAAPGAGRPGQGRAILDLPDAMQIEVLCALQDVRSRLPYCVAGKQRSVQRLAAAALRLPDAF